MNTTSAIIERIAWLRKITDKPDTCTKIIPSGADKRGWVMSDMDFLLKEIRNLKIINKALHDENFRLKARLD